MTRHSFLSKYNFDVFRSPCLQYRRYRWLTLIPQCIPSAKPVLSFPSKQSSRSILGSSTYVRRTIEDIDVKLASEF